MKRLPLFLLLPLSALAQDLAQYNKALSAFNSGDYDSAAATFFEVNETTTDQDLRLKSEYYLAQSLAKKGLPVSAMIQYGGIVRSGKAHPHYLKAVEGLVNLQKELDDQEMIPRTLDKLYSDDWATLPVEVLGRINYLVGKVSLRQGKYEDAKNFLEAVPSETSVYPKAQYLLGVALADLKFPGGAKNEEAIAAFERVLKAKAPNYEDLVDTQHLALLGLGRVWYGMGQYQKSVEAYERVPRFTKFWDQALFENGFARFQNDDYGGSLGSLQALHAPQFEGAFQPESWILKSTVYYFSCLYDEAKTTLAEYDRVYQPIMEKLKPLVEEAQDDELYFKLVNERSERIPKSVLNFIRTDERVVGLFKMLNQIDQEKSAITANQSWRGSKLPGELVSYLDQNRAVLIKLVGNYTRRALKAAHDTIRAFTDQAEIIRFETSKAEKEIAEQGIDHKKLLAQKTLYRPQMPAEDWNYWKFQGEFWIDEIGYYQYTLKKVCPLQQE